MPISRIHSVAFIALDTLAVEVEVDVIASDKTSIVIVGLPDMAVKESKDRVLTAIRNSGYPLTELHCTVNLAPGTLKKEGALYDLPIALGLLRSQEKIQSNHHQDYIIVGELGLGGELRPVRGALALALFAKESGKKGILLPAKNAAEAAMVEGIDVIPISHLSDAVKFLEQTSSITPAKKEISSDLFSSKTPMIDFSEIRGQAHAKRALEIAASGSHNLLLFGPPGSGKTMLSKALCGIMPELSTEEALDCTRIHSIVGLLKDGQNLITSRPFRAPHHTVSYAGLIGGGTNPRPGEVSLAHNGILFLDELPEFSRSTLEVLRQPLQDKQVTISRANGNFTFPTRFVCIAAMNPCPCGYLGHPDKECRDNEAQILRYKSKISGPLLDRLDMHLEVPALRYKDLMKGENAESSFEVRERVKAARQRQHKRFGEQITNAQMSSRQLKAYFPLNSSCQLLMQDAVDRRGMSVRAHDSIHRLAATIADLEDSDTIAEEHLLEALSYREEQLSSAL